MAAVATDEDTPWHTVPLETIYSRLETDSSGLSSDEATARRSKYGPNQLPQKEPTPAWLIFLRQFRSPLIYILGVAAVISIAIGETTDAGFIALVLVINAIIGGTQEFQAERSSRALQQLLRTRGPSFGTTIRSISTGKTSYPATWFCWSPVIEFLRISA